MTPAVCTLFEGHYHLGVGALINSLFASGYRGVILCGHRGPEPHWAEAARRLSGQIEVRFVPVNAGIHFTHYKPTFMRECWSRLCPDADQLYYFDPDIVVKAPWTVLARWAQDGAALVEDVNGYMPARHPYRLAWGDFISARGLPVARALDRYYNAGFLGLPRTHAALLDVWAQIVAHAQAELGSLEKIKFDTPHALLHTPDQDALNMALMATHIPINGTGPEGMDFAVGGHLLSHAIGGRKPWKGGFLAEALRGHPPGSAQKSFFHFVDSPLRLFSSRELAWLRLSLRSSALLGRMYRRA